MEQEKREWITKQLKETERLGEEIKVGKEREKLDEVKKIIGFNYETIKSILKEFIDTKEENYTLLAIWILGTYFYEAFETYPYLFVNAMKGSGKSRTLKLITALSHEGEMLVSMKEAVLFRTARGRTLCIDEFEGVNKKENAQLRELLNACYKKGIKVKRMKKTKTAEGEQQVVEEFEPFTPIVLANIWGMEEVLSDRCIPIILEKSQDFARTKLIENFSNRFDIKVIKANFLPILVYMCSYFSECRYIEEWNKYIKLTYTHTDTLTTLTTLTTDTTQEIGDKSRSKIAEEMRLFDIFRKIDETGINGRDLELMFPLLLISSFLGDTDFEEMIKIASQLTKDKKEEEMIESKDVALLDFVSNQDFDRGNYMSIKELTYNFRTFIGEDEEDDRWLNAKWFGRALKRLMLIKEKRRVGDGIQVILNIDKAKEKLMPYKKSEK